MLLPQSFAVFWTCIRRPSPERTISGDNASPHTQPDVDRAESTSRTPAPTFVGSPEILRADFHQPRLPPSPDSAADALLSIRATAPLTIDAAIEVPDSWR